MQRQPPDRGNPKSERQDGNGKSAQQRQHGSTVGCVEISEAADPCWIRLNRLSRERLVEVLAALR
jgi:hypothetical protein